MLPEGNVFDNGKEMATATTGLVGNLEVLRRLGGKQFQSYTTALVATVAVGCFLLVLNILIFAGIYHQREKRARDAKTKEELQDNNDNEMKLSSGSLKLNIIGATVECGGTVGIGTTLNNGDHHLHHHPQHPGAAANISIGGQHHHIKIPSGFSFGNYNCYNEKSQKTLTTATTCENVEQKLLLTTLPPPKSQFMERCWRGEISSNTSAASASPATPSVIFSMKRKKNHIITHSNTSSPVNGEKRSNSSSKNTIESNTPMGISTNVVPSILEMATYHQLKTTNPRKQCSSRCESSDRLAFEESKNLSKNSIPMAIKATHNSNTGSITSATISKCQKNVRKVNDNTLKGDDDDNDKNHENEQNDDEVDDDDDDTDDDDIPEPPPPPKLFQQGKTNQQQFMSPSAINRANKVATNTSMSIVDINKSNNTSIPSTIVGGGILRSSGSSSGTTTSGGKKRVHIQEISV